MLVGTIGLDYWILWLGSVLITCAIDVDILKQAQTMKRHMWEGEDVTSNIYLMW